MADVTRRRPLSFNHDRVRRRLRGQLCVSAFQQSDQAARHRARSSGMRWARGASGAGRHGVTFRAPLVRRDRSGFPRIGCRLFDPEELLPDKGKRHFCIAFWSSYSGKLAQSAAEFTAHCEHISVAVQPSSVNLCAASVVLWVTSCRLQPKLNPRQGHDSCVRVTVTGRTRRCQPAGAVPVTVTLYGAYPKIRL